MDYLPALHSAAAVLASTFKFLVRLVYLLTIPLHYPVYYIWALVSFLLSPVRALFNAVLGSLAFAVNMVARLKYLCIYLAFAAMIGICAGCALHRTSSFIYVLLGIDTTTSQKKQKRRQLQQDTLSPQGSQRLLPSSTNDYDYADEEDLYLEEDYEGEEEGEGEDSFKTTTYSDGSSSGRPSLTLTSANLRRFKQTRRDVDYHANARKKPADANNGDLFENQWKMLRSSEKPRRRRRGLLSQTIHEESSESDFS
ncbi:Uu.00g086790.m01.CDS01 [Anthostomella pinea]|uniref:Uu.00g086790.m01.CDS01 n=1 Tax=Anthostomella pinea TaxID=933095 RepID=A0AAI8VGT5_9PEZI|nr:Uu.00g086790.m01.CDS01 [Anthostomella pinea]